MYDDHAQPGAVPDQRSVIRTVLVLLLLTLAGATARSSETFSDAPTVGVAPAADESR